MNEEKTQRMFENIAENCNYQTVNSEKLKECLEKEHRYIQNEIMFSVILPMLEQMANNGYDRRNKKAVKKAQELLEE